MVKGREERHAEGTYCICFYNPKLTWQKCGPKPADALAAAERQRALFKAMEHGIVEGPKKSQTTGTIYTPPQDGLALPWSAGRPYRVWCNPPYGAHVGKWAQRMAEHGNGTLLIFGRTETQAWQEHIWPFADAILFPHGRVHFCLPSGDRAEGGTAPSSLVAYGQGNVEALVNSGIAGALVFKAQMIQGTQVSQL
jgi:hypothetical protein